MARYWVGGNSTWDATAGTKWALTSGGAGGQAVPTASDDVFLDNGAGTGNVTISGSRVCKSLDCTGYVGTLAGTSTPTLTVSGNITLVAGMTYSYAGSITINAASTMTSGGQTHTGALLLTSNVTYTLADNWTVTGTLSAGNNVSQSTVNGNTIYVGGSLTTTGKCLGTTVLNINGTGTWSGSSEMRLNITINTAGTLTLSGTVGYNTGTLTYTAGTISAGTSTFTCSFPTTLSCAGMTGSNAFANIALLSGASAITLAGNLECSGNFTSNSNGCLLAGAYTFTIMGNLDMSSMTTASLTSTTTKIVMGGTGFIKSPTTTGQIKIDTEIATSGTTTIFGTVNFSTQTFKYTAGTVGTSGTSILKFLTTAATCTLNATMVYAGSITTAVNTVFNGTNGFTVNDFTCITAGVSHTWAAGKTYTITTNLMLVGTAASNIVFVSGTPTSSYNFVVNSGATQEVSFVNSTDADSSAGITIWDYKGTLLRTVNWNLLTPPRTVGYTFVS